MIVDFWNQGLHPITLYGKDTEPRYRKPVKKPIKSEKDLSNNPDYISVDDAFKILGATLSKIRYLCKQQDIALRTHRSNGIYYIKKEDIECIDIVVPSISNDYISSSELMEILNINSSQLFKLALRKKWTKMKIIGNQNYYLKNEVL